MLAGISVEYYTQLERGNVKGVSEDVLEGVTRAGSSTTSNGPICSTSPAPQSNYQPGNGPSPLQVRPPVQGCHDVTQSQAALERLAGGIRVTSQSVNTDWTRAG